MYGKPNLKKIDDVGIEIFMEKYKPKTDGAKISCAKKLDASIMPRCERVHKVCCKNLDVTNQRFTF